MADVSARRPSSEPRLYIIHDCNYIIHEYKNRINRQSHHVHVHGMFARISKQLSVIQRQKYFSEQNNKHTVHITMPLHDTISIETLGIKEAPLTAHQEY